MADIQALKQNLDAAEQAKENLIVERRERRDALSKKDFRAFNEETRQDQLDAEKAVREARDALTAELNNARQELMVGTLSESNTVRGNTVGGAS